jgi:isoquinoline 1-oxidoreductase beta subunit
MVNPDTVEAQLQSSIAFGLSSTLGAEITLDKGRVQQTNFHDYPVIRMSLLASKPRFANVLKIAADKSGWGTPAPAGHFRGIALMEGYDTYMAQVAEVSIKDGVPVVHKVTVAADLGRMVNPDTVEAQIQSSIIFGLSAALYGEITLDKGRVQQTNFHQYKVVRMNEAPQIDITLVASTEKPGGIGEPATALIGPAVGNAVFAATGKRLRKMPMTADNIASA